MISKIVHLEPYFPTGELTVQPVMLWANGRKCVESISKYASAGYDYFKTIQPVPDHSIVYVLAVSSWEFYGENRNGDGFPEQPYKEDASPPWIAPADVLTQHYKSFEEFGHNFRHHANTDPEKAVGKIMKAFWNAPMHRAELLVDLDNKKAPDLAERITAGEFPPVSMGCRVKYDVCFLPETLVRTSEGHKEIQYVLEGTEVRTHTGVSRRVRATSVRTVEDGVYEVKAVGVPPIKCTDTHPFYVLRGFARQKTDSPARKGLIRTCQGSANDKRLRHQVTLTDSTCRRCHQKIDFCPEWVAAGDLRLGDYLLTPVDTSAASNTVGPVAAKLLGYYLGDGYVFFSGVTKSLIGVAFSLDTAWENIREDVFSTLNQLAENPAHEYAEGDGKNAVVVKVNDQGLATWLSDLGGRLSRGKRIAESVFTWSREEKCALIGGYIDTDGSYDRDRGSTRISTVNRGLALDTHRLLLSIGVPAFISFGGHTANTLYGSDTDHWYISIPRSYSKMFEPYSRKIESGTPAATKYAGSSTFFFAGYWCTPVTCLQSIPGTHDVYNLEVAEDESYLAEGIAVHNCNICGNRAPTRAQYCDHAKFQMRQTMPDGKTVCVLNPSPKFFDISWVFRPADPTAYMMKKVAEPGVYELSGAAAGEYIDKIAERKLAAKKLAVIDKIVQGLPVDAKTEGVDENDVHNLQSMRDTILSSVDACPDLPDGVLRQLAGHPLNRIFSTLFAGGMSLSTPEVVKIVIYKSYPKMDIGDDVLDRSVIMQRPMMDLLGDCPQLVDQMDKTGNFDISVENIDVKIAELIDPYFEKRSGISQYLKRRIVPEQYRPADPPYSTPLSVSDPATGTQYQTTRGAAVKAHDEIAKRNMYKVLGGAGLLAATYKLVGSGLTRAHLGKLKPVLGLSLGALGATQWPSMGPHYMTDQGIPIPSMTEMVPKHGSEKAASLAVPALGTLAAMSALGLDYKSRLRRGEPVGHPALPFSRRLLDRVEKFTTEHPVVSTVGGTLALARLGKVPAVQAGLGYAGRAAKAVGNKAQAAGGRIRDAFKAMTQDQVKMSALMGDTIPVPSGTVELPDIDLDQLTTKIGVLLFGG